MQKLIEDSDVFARLMEEHGNKEEGPDHAGDKDGAVDDGKVNDKPDTALMQIEERMTGAVSWGTYGQYLKYAGGIVWAPILLTMLTLSQCAEGSVFSFNSSDLRDSPSRKLALLSFLDFGLRRVFPVSLETITSSCTSHLDSRRPSLVSQLACRYCKHFFQSLECGTDKSLQYRHATIQSNDVQSCVQSCLAFTGVIFRYDAYG